jgi:hypothetical protein
VNRSAHCRLDAAAARHVLDADLAEVTREVPDGTDHENKHRTDKTAKNDSFGHDESSKKLWRRPIPPRRSAAGSSTTRYKITFGRGMSSE